MLLVKLSSYGIKGITASWITNYLFNRSQIITYNNKSSNPGEVTCGVPQGSILGPLLFSIFLNDITDHINTTKIIKYADDTAL